MTTDNLYLLLLVCLLITVREGFQQRDRVEPENGYSKAWHWFGFLMRFLVFALVFRLGQSWIYNSIAIVILWPLYNIACNIGMKQKWYYLSNKGIDGFIRKCLPFINFDK